MWSNFRAGLQGTLAASNAGHYWCVLEFELGQLLGEFTKADVWQRTEPVQKEYAPRVLFSSDQQSPLVHLLHLLFPSVWQSLFSQHNLFFHGHSLQSPDTTLPVVPCPQQVCWRRDKVVLKGDGSICISLYCFPNVWVLIPSVARNSFPLNGFYYAIHVWGGFQKALSQNSSYTRRHSHSLLVVLDPLWWV